MYSALVSTQSTWAGSCRSNCGSGGGSGIFLIFAIGGAVVLVIAAIIWQLKMRRAADERRRQNELNVPLTQCNYPAAGGGASQYGQLPPGASPVYGQPQQYPPSTTYPNSPDNQSPRHPADGGYYPPLGMPTGGQNAPSAIGYPQQSYAPPPGGAPAPPPGGATAPPDGAPAPAHVATPSGGYDASS
eukprot:NODE_8641_length_690_cov_54.661376_g8383_i0.p1 GENE.NODE_8641_length_690_cov_54.661376_g8383_i0~~NODE_8641_length_690_cov_54.661376_g8383_i0.p1  ORF type:complete len:187 (+),score=29.90 NODE_8641_length_690_cov_54.661376_g8383_i0:2-562(+)